MEGGGKRINSFAFEEGKDFAGCLGLGLGLGLGLDLCLGDNLINTWSSVAGKTFRAASRYPR